MGMAYLKNTHILLVAYGVLPPYHKTLRLGQRHGLQNTILTTCYYKNIYEKVVYVYFYENIFQDKSIHIIFIFANSTI